MEWNQPNTNGAELGGLVGTPSNNNNNNNVSPVSPIPGFIDNGGQRVQNGLNLLSPIDSLQTNIQTAVSPISSPIYPSLPHLLVNNQTLDPFSTGDFSALSINSPSLPLSPSMQFLPQSPLMSPYLFIMNPQQIMGIPSPSLSSFMSPQSKFLSPQMNTNPSANAGEEPYWDSQQLLTSDENANAVDPLADFNDMDEKFDFFPTTASTFDNNKSQEEKKEKPVKPSEMAHPLKKLKDAIGPDGKKRSVLFQCGYPGCDRTFTRPYNLKSHYRSAHTNERPYECSRCDMNFVRKHDLQRHMKLHQNDKPHVCPVCNKGFARSDALKRHRSTIDGKITPCSITPHVKVESQGLDVTNKEFSQLKVEQQKGFHEAHQIKVKVNEPSNDGALNEAMLQYLNQDDGLQKIFEC